MSVPPARRDRGSTLILVLVLVIVAGLILVPLMQYTMSVLRLNTAVSRRTADVQAAKGGLRVALENPEDVFESCRTGGDGTLPSVEVNDRTVTTTCSLVPPEIGPLEALGFEVPQNAVALQLGAEVPLVLTGSKASSDPEQTTTDWWTGEASAFAEMDTIWMPNLPKYPTTARTATPFDTTLGCQVFFPGHYADDLVLDTGQYYFASGVYYFRGEVLVEGDADVVVGSGLEEFDNDCADDYQVADNVVDGPETFAINGVGATWVFGADGHLVVDDTDGGTPSIRFNQRYADPDRGSRISVMTVNGDDDGTEFHDVGDDVLGDHDVPEVNLVPRSQLVTVEQVDDTVVVGGTPLLDNMQYAPSSSTYTDEARLPLAPVLDPDSPTASIANDGSGDQGAIRIVWDEQTGNETGGALITGYAVTVSDGVGPTGAVCDQPGDVVFTDPTDDVAGDGQFSCYVSGLLLDTSYDVSVAAVNDVGTGPPTTADVTTSTSDPPDAPPASPIEVELDDTDAPGTARIGWTPGDDGGVPITSYQAAIEQIIQPDQPVSPPVVHGDDVDVDVPIGSPTTVHVPATDPNGDELELIVDASTQPDWTVTTDGLDVTIEVPTGLDPPPVVTSFPFTVSITDPARTEVATGLLTVTPLDTVTADDPVVAHDFDSLPAPDVEVVHELPVTDAQGEPLAPVLLGDPVPVDPAVYDPTEWTVRIVDDGDPLTVDTHVGITTRAGPGTYQIPYTVSDGVDPAETATITVVVPDLVYEDISETCTVTAASPWDAIPTTCDVDEITGAVDPGAIGYRARARAVNSVGTGPWGYSEIETSTGFAGNGSPTMPPTSEERSVEPWTPEPVIRIRAGGAGSTTVKVSGYVAVPMGRVEVDNPDGDDIELIGGVLSGTFGIVDSRGDGTEHSVPIGFSNDIVLRRTVRIVSTAGSATSIAIVEVDADGTTYGINTWVVD